MKCHFGPDEPKLRRMLCKTRSECLRPHSIFKRWHYRSEDKTSGKCWRNVRGTLFKALKRTALKIDRRERLLRRVLSSARSRRWQRRKSWERSSCMRSYWQIWFVHIQTIGYKLFLSRTSILNQSSAESGHGVLNDLSLILWWWRCFQCRTKHDTGPHSQGGRIKSRIFTDWCAHVLFSSSQRSIKSQIS